MKTIHLFRVSILFIAIVLGGVAARAEDLGAVKARIAQRLPAIDTLKDRKVVGENNRGFLEARGTISGAEQKTMSDENADRGTVYAAIAQQHGTSADQVGRKRAQSIAGNSKAGLWVQDTNGSWRQK